MTSSTQVRYFRTAADFRSWLDGHHATETELLVGFYKKGSGKASITYPEALDEALCYGWIDGVRRSVDGERYVQRFTPRQARSKWSQVNIRRVGELTRAGHMHPAGVAAFERRDPSRPTGYSFESRPRELAPEYLRRFQAKKKAWAYFSTQPPGYRRLATYWVMEGKREETRLRRLDELIAASAASQRPKPFATGTQRNRKR